MLDTTLCYIEQDGKYLMLYRNKKKNDVNAGKWIGVGGKMEAGESPEDCVCREAREETGLTLTSFEKRGVVYFHSECWESEVMHLFTADGFTGELLSECAEGELRWIPKSEIMELSLWEGDRIFLDLLLRGEKGFTLTLEYDKEENLKKRELVVDNMSQ